MKIEKNINGNEMTVAVAGRLDTNTAPELEDSLKEDLNGITDLILNLKDLEYISSAGLRVLLSAQKIMNKQGKMTVKGANNVVMEVFEVTGFVDILNIED